LMGAAGAIKRTVRAEAGKSVSLDVPVFSGFVAISAPFVVEVSENGRPLGTSENQVILTPGHHDLRLTNRDLQFSAKEVVDVEPGEVKRIELDPRGTVNINAQPWAEVWIDGKKVGETPLANLSVPLGAREIVFKHPQFGERRVTTTIVSGTAAAVTMDFTKQ
jgi:PEGA domain